MKACEGAPKRSNVARLTIRDHILYHGSKENRVKHSSEAGTEVRNPLR